MDKLWDRKSFEVGGHWPLWRGWNNQMTTQNRQKSNAKKIYKHFTHLCCPVELFIQSRCYFNIPCGPIVDTRRVLTGASVQQLLYRLFVNYVNTNITNSCFHRSFLIPRQLDTKSLCEVKFSLTLTKSHFLEIRSNRGWWQIIVFAVGHQADWERMLLCTHIKYWFGKWYWIKMHIYLPK